VAQAEGTAFKIEAKSFRAILRRCPQLAFLLLRYSQEAVMQVTQLAACNRLCGVDARLARWLLMSQDRIDSDFLPLTQEFLGQMLGIRRASVSVSAAVLQKAGLIKYAMGHVTVLDRPGLEKASCECYGVMERQLESWRMESN
jgi:CRP-like cAMP-binding protein